MGSSALAQPETGARFQHGAVKTFAARRAGRRKPPDQHVLTRSCHASYWSVQSGAETPGSVEFYLATVREKAAQTTTRPSGHVTYDNSGRIVLISGGVSGTGRAI